MLYGTIVMLFAAVDDNVSLTVPCRTLGLAFSGSECFITHMRYGTGIIMALETESCKVQILFGTGKITHTHTHCRWMLILVWTQCSVTLWHKCEHNTSQCKRIERIYCASHIYWKMQWMCVCARRSARSFVVRRSLASQIFITIIITINNT